MYWEFTISGTCAYVGLGTQDYSIASCPGLGEESWAIGDSGFGAELHHNATVELNVDLSHERGATFPHVAYLKIADHSLGLATQRSSDLTMRICRGSVGVCA